MPDVTTVNSRVSHLVHCNKFADVENLLNRLPNTPEYQDNEEITRAKIALAWHKKDVQTVYKLIEEGKFSNGEDLILIWDQAHVYEAKARTAVQRHRLRQRFMPPPSICPSGFRKEKGIPKATCKALQEWFTERISNPYPDKTERLMLAHQHGLTLGQLKNWFANARRRLRDSTPGECPKNLRQHRGGWKPAEHVTPSVNQSEKSLALSLSETQEKQPQNHQGTVAEDVTPSVNQSETGLTLSSSETQEEQPQSIDSANLPPQVMWNSVFNYPGVSSVIVGPQFETYVATGRPYQLPWLPNVTLFPAIPSASFPASLSLPRPVWWSNHSWQGNEDTSVNFENN
ncbi:hypothetical protein ACROYT_G006156 [Oculina patagonica]